MILEIIDNMITGTRPWLPSSSFLFVFCVGSDSFVLMSGSNLRTFKDVLRVSNLRVGWDEEGGEEEDLFTLIGAREEARTVGGRLWDENISDRTGVVAVLYLPRP